MIVLNLHNRTKQPYEDVRDELCAALVGNRAFVENDIVISDICQDENVIQITLGGEGKKDLIFTGALCTKISAEPSKDNKSFGEGQ